MDIYKRMRTNSKHQTMKDIGNFYIAAHESGHTEYDLPIWTSKTSNSITFTKSWDHKAERIDLLKVPGSFQIINVLNDRECEQLIEISNALGYHEDAPVSLPRRIRHNNNFNWVVDESIDGPIWNRCKAFLSTSSFSGLKPLGLNARFRFYKYGPGDFFAPHTDGAWPGSRIINGCLISDAYGDRISEMTFLIFLSNCYEGGRTIFQTEEGSVTTVSTPKGAVLCFPHGLHPDHCIHSGEEVLSGQKYVIRTDVLYGQD